MSLVRREYISTKECFKESFVDGQGLCGVVEHKLHFQLFGAEGQFKAFKTLNKPISSWEYFKPWNEELMTQVDDEQGDG